MNNKERVESCTLKYENELTTVDIYSEENNQIEEDSYPNIDKYNFYITNEEKILSYFYERCNREDLGILRTTGENSLYKKKLRDKRWIEKREKIRKRDRYRCQYCHNIYVLKDINELYEIVDFEEIASCVIDVYKQIQKNEIKFEVDKEEYNKDVEENHVISQDPTYFEKYHSVKQGSTVKVVISKGTEKATVPKVVGMKQDDAVKALEDANLKAEVVEETSKKVQAGYVISQDVDENTEVSAGDSVKIHVSKGTGIKQLTMVNVVGQDADSAKSTLEGMGLKVNITYATSTADNGKVSKQSVAEGKTVDEGTTVTLTVNKVAENKTITISVNVKAITGGYTETTEKADNKTDNTAATTTNVSKTVNIKVNGETRTGVSKNESNCTVSLNGKDGQSETVTVTITDPNSGSTIYSSSQPATFGTTNTLTFTK